MNVGDEGRLHYGLYELLHSRRLPRERFPEGAIPDFEKVEDAERIRVLTTYVAQRLEQQLTIAKTEEQIYIINRALRSFDPDDEITVGDKQSIAQLVALKRSNQEAVIRPSTPLSDVTLLTNAPKQPSLSRELEHELASADRVDLLCSFLKLSGISVLRDALGKAQERGVPVRIIATTYMGATDAKAVQALHDLGAEIKISYQNNTTRLHAEAWLFERNTGFSTGYVGSSNLSAAAMTDGLEWNVRLSSVQTPGALQQFRAAFDGYWNDPEFVTYSPDQYEQLDDALRRASKSVDRRMAAIDTTFLDVYARPHQAIMLDHLAAERSRGHHKNLVVAATGTGKTILSALDFKYLRQSLDNSTFLFIAHRTQILQQARLSFQSTLRDRDFGEIFADGMRPRNWKHVFASIQTLRGEKLTSLPTDHFDVVIIDEFHHASAPTYGKVIEHFTPRELVGLTATPERGDGVNVATKFFDGRIATELRLWDALDADLLVPFHYFGIKDDTDLSAARVSQGEVRHRQP